MEKTFQHGKIEAYNKKKKIMAFGKLFIKGITKKTGDTVKEKATHIVRRIYNNNSGCKSCSKSNK